jgi:hypothetical protein
MAIVASTALVDLPALRGRLLEAETAILLRLRLGAPVHDPGGTTRPGTTEATRWLTPAEAARIADIPVKRLYEWAKGKRWTSRPTRRCLRIDAAGFQQWLTTRP